MSFHVPFMFHVPSMFLSCCIHVFSCSFHLHASSFHSAFISFHFVSKAMEMGLWLGQRTECNKWLSLSYRQTTLQHMTLFEGIFRKTTEVERERGEKNEREREKESERVGYQMTWYSNCRKHGTTGWISLIGFARWVFAWFTPSLMDCRVQSQLIFFLGGAYRFTVFRAHLWTKNSCNTKVVLNHFDCD